MKIHVQHLAAQGVVLDFLHQGEALGAGVVLDGEIHQQVFRNGMVDQVLHFLGVDLQVLGRLLAAINDSGDAPGVAQFLDSAPARLRAGKCIQWYRFHFFKLFRRFRRTDQLVRPPLNSNSEVTDELLLIRLMASPNNPATDKVVILTPSIAGRRTVSVVINSSILDFRNLSIPTSFKIAWETQARIFLAPFLFKQGGGRGQRARRFRSNHPPSARFCPRISPMTVMDSISRAFLRRLATMARPASSTCE